MNYMGVSEWVMCLPIVCLSVKRRSGIYRIAVFGWVMYLPLPIGLPVG